jgi:hypothetical protein
MPPCCIRCAVAKPWFLTEENEHLWTKERGFWDNGCKLGRDKMPQECKDYDCHKFLWDVRMFWRDGWQVYFAAEITNKEEVERFKKLLEKESGL